MFSIGMRWGTANSWKSIYDTNISVIVLFLKKKWYHLPYSNSVPLLSLSIITLPMIIRINL